jgi:hypothetical protein
MIYYDLLLIFFFRQMMAFLSLFLSFDAIAAADFRDYRHYAFISPLFSRHFS